MYTIAKTLMPGHAALNEFLAHRGWIAMSSLHSILGYVDYAQFGAKSGPTASVDHSAFNHMVAIYH